MINNNNGGSAFPITAVEDQDGKLVAYTESGMTLRDYFANSALKGFCSTAEPTSQYHFNNLATDAYRMADAMLAAREVGNE